MGLRLPNRLVGLAAATTILVGCGSAGSSESSTPTAAGSATATASSPGPITTQTVRPTEAPPHKGAASGTSTASAALTIPGLGTLNYNCGGSPPSPHGVLGGRVLATETVHVQDGALTHLRAGQLGPPAKLAATASGRVMLWHIIQSNEAQTTDAVLRISFDPDCSSARWSTSVRTFGHQGRWRVPAPWL